MTATLLLRLAAPTQAWDSRRERAAGYLARGVPASTRIAGAGLVPTSTGVVGMLGAALGRQRGADMTDLRGLDMLIREDQPGRPRLEFRTRRRRNASGQIATEPLVESVVDDAAFLVALGGDRGLVEQVAAALLAPRWALYLGQRCYPPTPPVLLGVVDGGVGAAARTYPWIAARWWRQRQPYRVVLQVRRPRPEPRGTGAAEVLDPVVVDNPEGLAPPDWLCALARGVPSGMEG